jgi:RNA polymerase sigma-70 factor (ECF subfamily)
MVGSVIDGEDVVQETLERGYYELSALQNPPALRSWLFRIAHNRALDHLRKRRPTEPLDAEGDAVDTDSDPNNLLPREQAVTVAMAHFLQLAPSQRSCVILKDVLDYSLEEIASSLDLSIPAVKAALHRGRTRLKFSKPAEVAITVSPTVHRYAELFNARNWDAVRDMLIEDVRLEVLDATSRRGRKEVGVYFTRYANMEGWQVVPAVLDGHEGVTVLPRGHFVELTVQGDQIAMIRDFFHIPYLVDTHLI